MICGEYSVCWGRRMKNIIFEIRPAEYGLYHKPQGQRKEGISYLYLIPIDHNQVAPLHRDCAGDINLVITQILKFLVVCLLLL